MVFALPRKLLVTLSLILLAVFAVSSSKAQDIDLSSSYQWKPVRIGAGGWMRGMAVSPTDSTRRYARGDVDNVYRWDQASQQWYPTKISSAMPANVTVAPASAGGGAIAIDPQNPNHVCVVYTLSYSADLSGDPLYPSLPSYLNVYCSTDGGVTFQAGNLALQGNLSQETTGERLAIDPNNGNVIYLGSPGAQGYTDGLFRSTDGGATWTLVSGGGYPANTSALRYEAQLPRFDGGSGTVTANGVTSTKILYVTYIKHNENNSDAVSGAGVLKSADGGVTWTDVSGTIYSNTRTTAFATMDTTGNLWVAKASTRSLYKLSRAGLPWTTYTPTYTPVGIAVDPSNLQRIFIAGSDGLARSLNGGTSWTNLGSSFTFSTTQPIGWLTPSPIRPQNHYISVSGLYMDPSGKLWINCGNDGIITATPNDATDTSANPPVWTSSSVGIEEMVAEESILPPGGKPGLTVEDEALFTILNPDASTALHFPIILWDNTNNGLATGQDITYAPNQPLYLAQTADNSAANNPLKQFAQFGGYSADGGLTWNLFPSVVAGTHPCVLYNGLIAVSARAAGHENDPPGADNLVWFPSNSGYGPFAQTPAPYYSKNGGATWTL